MPMWRAASTGGFPASMKPTGICGNWTRSTRRRRASRARGGRTDGGDTQLDDAGDGARNGYRPASRGLVEARVDGSGVAAGRDRPVVCVPGEAAADVRRAGAESEGGDLGG